MPSNSIDRVSLPSQKTVLWAILGGAVVVGALVISGCNTVAGAGKDVQAAGTGIENAAEKAKD